MRPLTQPRHSICMMRPGERLQGWPDDAHIKDVRPLAGKTREQLYERHANWRTRKGLYREDGLFGN